MNIQQIIDRFKSDTAFAEKYSALTSVEAILEQAKADGFEVTADDVEAAIGQLGKQTGELSEADLAVVAGGKERASDFCFYRYSDEPQKHIYMTIRKKCGRGHCHHYYNDGRGRKHCACYDTDACINSWHIVERCGNPSTNV